MGGVSAVLVCHDAFLYYVEDELAKHVGGYAGLEVILVGPFAGGEDCDLA